MIKLAIVSIEDPLFVVEFFQKFLSLWKSGERRSRELGD